MVDTHHYMFIQTHRMNTTQHESYGRWTLGDNVSVQVHQR